MANPTGVTGTRVLIVDDDATVTDVIRGYLLRDGFVVDHALDGPAALAAFDNRRPDLIVLDRMLPEIDGIDVCRRIRQVSDVPIIMLTALGDEDSRILGLQVGADDYLTKPFSPKELILRVQAVLRRGRPATELPRNFTLGDFDIDSASRTITRLGTPLTLTVREFDLLAFLLRHPRRAFGREELIRTVWGWGYGDLNTVTVHARRLREKIEDNPARPRYLTTVWGIGYRFDPGGKVVEQ